MREFLPTLNENPGGGGGGSAGGGSVGGEGGDGVEAEVSGDGDGVGDGDGDEEVEGRGEAAGESAGGAGGRAWQEDGAADGLPFRYVVTDVAQVRGSCASCFLCALYVVMQFAFERMCRHRDRDVCVCPLADS